MDACLFHTREHSIEESKLKQTRSRKHKIVMVNPSKTYMQTSIRKIPASKAVDIYVYIHVFMYLNL